MEIHSNKFSYEDEINYFCSYIKIKTVHPVSNDAYEEAAIFLTNLGEKNRIGL
jgi:hypothetical protein